MSNIFEKKEFIKIAEESGIGEDDDRLHLPPRYECPICLNCLKDPVLTSCGHKFCSQCINDWFKKVPPCCPVDYRPLKPESDLFRDLCTSREISQQRAQCPYQKFGCNVKLSLIEMDAHVTDCKHKNSLLEIYCIFKSVGCDDKFLTMEELNSHVDKSTNLHLMMLLKIMPQSVLNHSNPKALESNFWEAPSKSKGNKSESNEEQQLLIKNLYEKIIALEQENQELRNQLTIIRNSQGVFIWRLKSFCEVMNDMSTGKRKFTYSPAFYASANGYKFGARLNIARNNRNYLTLVLHTLQSENDDALDWPFRGMILFTLVHPHDSSKNMCEIANSVPDMETFQRPNCLWSEKGFGYTEFIRIDQLDDFIFNNQLIIRIEVKPSSYVF